MKILAISASPRRQGNSETLLDKELSSIKKGSAIKKVVLSNLDIAPCTGCEACFKTGECIIKDDMQALYKDLLACDILLIASPIYFQGLPCQLKCAIDRCQALWSRKYILKKVIHNRRAGLNPPYYLKGQKGHRRLGTAILVSASSGAKNTFTGAVITLRAWFKTLDFAYKKEFLAQGLEAKNAALKDKKLLKKTAEFGKKLSTTVGRV